MTLSTVQLTIPSGQALSNGVQVPGIIVGIEMPASWTAAPFTFQSSTDGVTYNDVYDAAGNELDLFLNAPAYNGVRQYDIPGSVFLKVRSGTTGTPVDQPAFGGVTVTLTVQV